MRRSAPTAPECTASLNALLLIGVPLHDNLGEIYRDNLGEVVWEYQDNPGEV
jgi:hypothetical protein